jgi:hypothetical protein
MRIKTSRLSNKHNEKIWIIQSQKETVGFLKKAPTIILGAMVVESRYQIRINRKRSTLDSQVPGWS